MGYKFDIGKVTEEICENCPLIHKQFSGISNGEQIDQDERTCPLEGVPKLVIDDEEIVCDVRQNG